MQEKIYSSFGGAATAATASQSQTTVGSASDAPLATSNITPDQVAALQSQLAALQEAGGAVDTATLARLLQQSGGGSPIVTFDLPQTLPKNEAPRNAVVTETNQIRANWGIADATDTFATGEMFTRKLFLPNTPQDVSAAIQQAEADKATIRALGSGWSFSEAVLPQSTPTNAGQYINEQLARVFGGAYAPLFNAFGYAIDTSALTQNLQRMLPGIVKNGVNTGSLFFTEAGITIDALNVRLNEQSPPVAMPTLGGSAGQTIAGAISTGTHGSDFDRPPIADSVRALYIIGAAGTHHWVESKSNQFTDPQKVNGTFPAIAPANIHYDDDLFNAAIVGMGALGVIYAVVLYVVPQFALIQFNLWSTWEQLLQLSVGGVELTSVARGQAFPSLNQFVNPLYPPNDGGMPYSRALQVVVNPIRNDDGTHTCYATVRLELPLAWVPNSMRLPWGLVPGNLGTLTLQNLKDAILNSPDCGPAQQVAFAFANISGNTLVQQAQSLINFCKSYNYFWAVRAVIDLMMQHAFPQYIVNGVPTPQIDLGFKVMTGNIYGITFPLGGATSIEVAFPFVNAIEYVSSALAAFDAGIPNNIFPAGYLSLRACGPTAALLGMQQFGALPTTQRDTDEFPNVTGNVEISLLGNSDDFSVIHQVETLALAQGGILHWGQSNGLLNGLEVQQRFPGLAKWKTAQGMLGGATFVNLFMQRCGLA
ncbi:MAG TPA: hypothetical protein VKB79_08175 [Bryobacteraceae bacterium]|nr:hypothetical protein [Bryobacteraceae bacterium]